MLLALHDLGDSNLDVTHQVSEIIISPVKHPRNISGTTENMDLHPRVLGEHRTPLLASQGTRISTAGFVERTQIFNAGLVGSMDANAHTTL